MAAEQSQFPTTEQDQNTYVMDPESAAEMARLMRQDQLITVGMGGIFPEPISLDRVRYVLDLACGPGGWPLEVAYTYSDTEVIGIDISDRMIAYASAQARVQQRSNVRFQVMNILKPLDFPNDSFDLVNARLISGFMLQANWPSLFRECMRVLRPGGLLRITEVEPGLSNKPYFEKSLHTGIQAMHRAGLNFSPNGFHYGIVHMLPYFFRQAGLSVQGQMAHGIEFSFGTEAHDGFYHDLSTALHLLESLVVKTQTATADEWRDLSMKAMAEMYEEDFCALWMFLTVWGSKPE